MASLNADSYDWSSSVKASVSMSSVSSIWPPFLLDSV